MTIDQLLMSIQDTALAGAVRGDEGWVWLFPIDEVFHVLFLTLVFGSIIMVDLRLLGVSSRNVAVSKLSAEVLPYTWVAFICAAITGTLMFISKAHTYFYNRQFELKFICMALAGVNMLVFHAGAYRRVLEWDNRLPPPTSARVAGAVSISLWVAVIFFGRWIGFTT